MGEKIERVMGGQAGKKGTGGWVRLRLAEVGPTDTTRLFPSSM